MANNKHLSLLSIFIIASMMGIVVDGKKLEVNATDEYSDEDLTFGTDAYMLKLIFPGTKWCGAGNSASNFNDLGKYPLTDLCCRDHDHCEDLILEGESKHGLTNDASYTRLSCECDETFRKCLRDNHSTISSRVGKLYFNALATQCFRKDYPITGCAERGGWFFRKCIKYEYNYNAEPKYQWFYVHNY